MQKKPISTSTFTFETLTKGNTLYVDKTRYFYNLITSSDTCYFCSRPRRFGKSLALSIFESIFLGKKELFDGLFIADTDYEWETFPVIHIDMARCDLSTAENLALSLHKQLFRIAKKYDVQLEKETPTLEFESLIEDLKEKTGKNVVILIDEYDKPLTDNIDDLKNLEKVRKVLESFYQIIKSQEPNERFVFMTGITRFAKVGVFSKLNNLTDITMSRDYACMFGYTQEELEKYFAPYIDDYTEENKADRNEFVAKIKKWYDGFKFHWKAETVYNPVSAGQFFNNSCEFRNYWFATGTPTLAAELIPKCGLAREDIECARISTASFDSFNIAEMAGESVSRPKVMQLLLQSGYITIDSLIDETSEPLFSVRFPNYEVDISFTRLLFELQTGMKFDEATPYIAGINEAARKNDVERMVELFRNFIAGIPYEIHIPSEKYYQSTIFSILKMCGMNVEAEHKTNKGRIDACFETKDRFYIIEFKLDKSADEALEQIRRKEYFQKYIEDANKKGKRICCLGINFSSEERNITDWRCEFI